MVRSVGMGKVCLDLRTVVACFSLGDETQHHSGMG
jgi:hypothetical protein